MSVIVPVCDGGEPFRRCLASLAALDPRPLESIVVADGDGDGSWRLAEPFATRIIRRPSRGGPGAARNAGAAGAAGEILCFLDADVTAPPDLLARIAEAFRQEPDLAAVFGSYDDEPGGTGFLSQFKDLTHHFVHQTSSADASTFWGACGAVRAPVFRHMGGFDERFREPSIEDIELGYRMRRAGHTIRLLHSLQVKHWKVWTVRSIMVTETFRRAAPWTRLILQQRELPNDLNLRHVHRASVLLSCAIPVTALMSLWSPSWLAAAASQWAILLLMNRSLYRFYHERRGAAFAVRAIPWHHVHYVCCAAGFACGVVTWLRAGWSDR